MSGENTSKKTIRVVKIQEQKIIKQAQAKINLSLQVQLKQVTDSMHSIQTNFQTIRLYDVVTLTNYAKLEYLVETVDENYLKLPISLCVVGNPHWVSLTPPTNRNLVVKAVQLLVQELSTHSSCRSVLDNLLNGVHIEIDKHIPVQAGLGGGSADAAAVLSCLRNLFELVTPLSPTDFDDLLFKVANEVGADVLFGLQSDNFNGTALGTGVGNILEASATPDVFVEARHIVLIIAQHGLSTAEVYAKFDQLVQSDDQLATVRQRYINELQVAALTLYPEVADVGEIAQRALNLSNDSGVEGVFRCNRVAISGSGPTWYALCNSKEEVVAVKSALATHEHIRQIIVVDNYTG